MTSSARKVNQNPRCSRQADDTDSERDASGIPSRGVPRSRSPSQYHESLPCPKTRNHEARREGGVNEAVVGLAYSAAIKLTAEQSTERGSAAQNINNGSRCEILWGSTRSGDADRETFGDCWEVSANRAAHKADWPDTSHTAFACNFGKFFHNQQGDDDTFRHLLHLVSPVSPSHVLFLPFPLHPRSSLLIPPLVSFFHHHIALFPFSNWYASTARRGLRPMRRRM